MWLTAGLSLQSCTSSATGLASASVLFAARPVAICKDLYLTCRMLDEAQQLAHPDRRAGGSESDSRRDVLRSPFQQGVERGQTIVAPEERQYVTGLNSFVCRG